MPGGVHVLEFIIYLLSRIVTYGTILDTYYVEGDLADKALNPAKPY
jgi:hypothetical protein